MTAPRGATIEAQQTVDPAADTIPAETGGAPDSGSDLAFCKYTSFGNTFIIVDETVTPLADDAQRASFARWALNGDFGIGGTDNVLYLRRLESTSDSTRPLYDFRIFEIDGSETLSCGNGLLSTAGFLHRSTGEEEWGVLTELPTGDPKEVGVGIHPKEPGRTWVNVGWARAVPADLLVRSGPPPKSGIDRIEGLEVPLPADAGWAAGLPATVTLSGGLSFTGEPHLALVEGRGLPEEVASRIFPAIGGEAGAAGRVGQPESPTMRASRALVHHLGQHVNQVYRHQFPLGVHLNFARVRNEHLVEYRTWERAIDKETLACGSGTVAMAHILGTDGLVSDQEVTFWPHRCRWYQPDASLEVVRTDRGYLLGGRPRLVCAGTVPRTPQSSAGATES